MAQLNLEFYKGIDVYSDGDIENHIMDLVTRGVQLSDLPAEEVSYPVLYHLSRERENVLCWYPFRKGANVLEVGAGCGAITGALCRSAHSVTSVDLSLRRSRINYERNKQYSNLQIFVGNLNDMVFQEKFDYVVINGVLEYAISFTEGKHPYEEFLNNQLKYMKEDGRALIAIENRLGLKYFAGAPEDHTDTYYLGLNHYENNRSVRTFSKTELTDILKRCGLSYVKYYYPYPDYKFPNEIFTDETLFENGYGRDYYNYRENRLELFPEPGVAHDLNREGVTDVFANSFLVEAGWQEPKVDKQVLYAKVNSDRAERFQIVTTIEREKSTCTVYKRALTKAAREHLQNMSLQEQKQQMGEYTCLAGKWDGIGVRYRFLQGGNLDSFIAKDIHNRDAEAVKRRLKSLFEKGFVQEQELEEIYTPAFQEVFGPEKIEGVCKCVKPANIDLICGNIFVEGEKYKVIDGEWIFDFWIPKAFIIWRTLNELYCLHRELTDIAPKAEMFRKFDIRDMDIPVFECWNHYFTEEYVKANQMRLFSKEKQRLDLTEFMRKRQEDKRIGAALYVDYGDGFCEMNKLYQEQELTDGRFCLIYQLEDVEHIRALRWDPVEDRLCKCMAYQVTGEKKERLRPRNACLETEKWDEFDIPDSQYYVNIELIDGSAIVIEGVIMYISGSEALKNMVKGREKLQIAITELENDMIRLQNEQEQVKREVHELKQQRDEFAGELQRVYETRGWKILEKMRKCMKWAKGE